MIMPYGESAGSAAMARRVRSVLPGGSFAERARADVAACAPEAPWRPLPALAADPVPAPAAGEPAGGPPRWQVAVWSETRAKWELAHTTLMPQAEAEREAEQFCARAHRRAAVAVQVTGVPG